MKAIGYVRCAVCQAFVRGYAPRGWKAGDPLATWAHGPDGVARPFRVKCDGSYKPGGDSRLDADLAAGRIPTVRIPAGTLSVGDQVVVQTKGRK